MIYHGRFLLSCMADESLLGRRKGIITKEGNAEREHE